MENPETLANLLKNPAVTVAVIGLIGVLIGHLVSGKNNKERIILDRESKENEAKITEQQIRLERQRADINGLTAAVEGLKALTDAQSTRIEAIYQQLTIKEAEAVKLSGYIQQLDKHINEIHQWISAGANPPPPTKPFIPWISEGATQ